MKKYLTLAVMSVLTLISCDKDPLSEGRGGSGSGSNIVNSQPKEGLTMTHILDLNKNGSQMNSHADEPGRSGLVLVQDTYQQLGAEVEVKYPSYPRVCRIGDGSYMVMWQADGVGGGNGKDTYYAISKDFKTWTNMGKLFASRYVTTYLGASALQKHTNANALVLSDGRLMVVSSFYTLDTYSKSGVDVNDTYTLSDGTKEQGIRIKFSSDHGKTWTSEQVIYYGPNWEAHLMETEEGQIQCYFSESRPKISGSHSGTSLIVSDDRGVTWTPGPGSKPYRVMRKHWEDADEVGGVINKYTYQMPVGIRLNGSDQMAFSMECIHGRIGALKHAVSVVYSPMSGEWKHLEDDEIGPTGDNLENFTDGTSPYLLQFKSGETVLSYCNSGMQYRMGDAKARNFGGQRKLFANTSGGWAGMGMDTDHTIMAVDRNTKIAGAEGATIAIGKFYLNHSITATSRTVTADGSAEEWTDTDEALYIGNISQARAVIRCSADSENIYFLVEHNDDNFSKTDFMAIMVTPETASGRLDGTSRRIRFNCTGVKSFDQFAGGWRPIANDVSGAVVYEGTVADKEDVDNGYIAEIVVPRKDLDIKDGKLLLNAILYDAGAAAEDGIVSSASKKTENWVYIRGL